MNNPNPFVPQGSLLDQQSKRQSRMKLAVFCVLAVSVTGLMAMLIQGCKRDHPVTGDTPDTSAATVDTNAAASTLSPESTNTVPDLGSNTPPIFATNPPPVIPAPIANTTPVVPAVAEVPAVGSEYVVVTGDTFGKIAKKTGVTVKALEAANPDVQPTKLKVGHKLTIPAGGKSTADAATPMSAGSTDVGGEVYVVKSGDTLTKIAKGHGTTVKAIKAANNLTTTQIKVGQKLKIPAKAEVPAAPAPADTTPVTSAPAAAPNLPPVTTPAPATTPATTPAPAH